MQDKVEIEVPRANRLRHWSTQPLLPVTGYTAYTGTSAVLALVVTSQVPRPRALSPGAASPSDACEADWVQLRTPREPPVLKAQSMLCLRKRKRILLSKETWERADAPTASGVPWRTFSGRRVGGLASRYCAGSGALPLPLPGSFSQRRRKARRLRVECGWWESLGGLRNPSSGIYQSRSFPLASVPA
nr:uncharacterized protein LOC123573090 [Macaca fascicularis]